MFCKLDDFHERWRGTKQAFFIQLEEDRVGHPGDLQSSSGCATANTSQGNGGDAPKVANVYDDNMW